MAWLQTMVALPKMQASAMDDRQSMRATDISRARDPAVALCRRRIGAGDGAGRRRDAAHRIRPFDHRVEAADGRACRRCPKARWQAAFEKYQAIPQYRELNTGMSLAEFKTIYWWEWTHRLLGRVDRRGFPVAVSVVPLARLGGAGAAPAAVVHFRARRAARRVGWWMVASGLADRVEVSQYRLATHLLLACAIYVALIWTAWRMGERPAGRVPGAHPLSEPARACSFSSWRKSISARWSPVCARVMPTTPGR